MQHKLLLQKSKSVLSTNKELNLPVNLINNHRLLPYDGINDKLNLYKLYLSERDNCNKYRMIFTINSLCSNVLYNTRTEFVRNEGSSECEIILGNYSASSSKLKSTNKTSLDWQQAIRDTEYSSKHVWDDKSPLVYHCGFDIFNNHMLRNKDFVVVSKNNNDSDSEKTFNTINDFVRDFNGNVREEVMGLDGETTDRVHTYGYDSINTMSAAFSEKISEDNGWIGFTNETNMHIPNIEVDNKMHSINRIMNNNKPCEFIDLYPDRSLFSFIPKYNKYKNRPEKNWDYCITYPYKNDFDKLNEIIFSGGNIIDYTSLTEENGRCANKILNAYESNFAASTEIVRFKTMFRHTLKGNDYITLYYDEYDTVTKKFTGKLIKYSNKIKVFNVGDNEYKEKDRYFTIKLSDISWKFGYDENKQIVYRNSTGGTTNQTANFYYKKNVNDNECQYYFRKFKKLTKDGKELSSEINKIAFGENIYGDRNAQIIFTDDIDIENLTDNNKRDLSEMYLTIIKRNKGWEEWYNSTGGTFSEDVEYSHCFGKVTSGIDMPIDDNCKDYNVRRLHNVNLNNIASSYKNITKQLFSGISEEIKTIDESDITIDDSEFYGDIVEYDAVNAKETIIEKVYYRFNTAQRETTNSKYYDILYDNLKYDDYDKDINSEHTEGFKVESEFINTIGDSKYFAGNINPEGYFYNPHNKIKLKEVNENLSSVSGKTLSYCFSGISSGTIRQIESMPEEYYIDVQFMLYYKLYKDDTIAIYDKKYKTITWGIIRDTGENIHSGTTARIILQSSEECNKIIDLCYEKKAIFITSENGIPFYATYLPISHTFVWRNVLLPSETPEDNDLSKRPMTNGRIYVQQNINFFLKRQDPRNEYYLLSPDDLTPYYNPLKAYKIWGNDKIDFSTFQYTSDIINVCN